MCQVFDHISPAPGPSHHLAGLAVVLSPEGGPVCPVASSPAEMRHEQVRPAPEHQQVLRQLTHRRKVIHVDEGLRGQQALVVLPGWTQDHWDCPGLDGVPELFGYVVGVLRVFQREVELVVADQVHHVPIKRLSGASIHIHPEEPPELLVEHHPGVGHVPVADDPGQEAGSDQFAGRRRPQILIRVIGDAASERLGYQKTVRQENIGVPPVCQGEIKNTLKKLQTRGVGGGFIIHPNPLLRSWSEFLWKGGARDDVPVVHDHSICLSVHTPVIGDPAPSNLVAPQAAPKLAVLSERVGPEEYGHHAVVLGDRPAGAEVNRCLRVEEGHGNEDRDAEDSQGRKDVPLPGMEAWKCPLHSEEHGRVSDAGTGMDGKTHQCGQRLRRWTGDGLVLNVLAVDDPGHGRCRCGRFTTMSRSAAN